MSGSDTNLMEGDILQEENLGIPKEQTQPQNSKPAAPKKTLPKFDSKNLFTKLSKLKRPKPITIIIVFFVMIIMFSSLVVLEDKIPQEQILDPDILITSPRPTPKISEDLQKVLDEVNAYDSKVKNLNESFRNYPPPKVDLDVKF